MTTSAAAILDHPPDLAEQKPAAGRYLALDAMRGFVMLVLVSKGFGLGALKNQPEFQAAYRQFSHLPWEGFVLWELIMPSFMFMVGASLPFALAHRSAKGSTFPADLRYIAFRVLKLILLGQILTTIHKGYYWYEPFETLTQLGISYFFAYLILQLPWRLQPLAAASFLALNWTLYQLFPGSEGPFSPQDNIGVVIDRQVFALNHAGRWATINFLGSAITVLFGAWTAQLLSSRRTQPQKIKALAACAAGSFLLMLALMPFVPIIHKAWTVSYTFAHTSAILTMVLAFVWLFDARGYHRLAFPLRVVGLNSIFIYLASNAMSPWLDKTVGAFTGRFAFAGPIAPALQACAVAVVLWLACYWLYQRKIFFKV